MEFENQKAWKSVLNPTVSSDTKTREGHDSSDIVQNPRPFEGSSNDSMNSVESEKLISSADSKSSLIQDGHDY